MIVLSVLTSLNIRVKHMKLLSWSPNMKHSLCVGSSSVYECKLRIYKYILMARDEFLMTNIHTFLPGVK